VIIEIKTRLDDVGAMERQLAWYERDARPLARNLGWAPRITTTWLLLLVSDEVEGQIAIHRDLLRRSFPDRARTMRSVIRGASAMVGRRGWRSWTRRVVEGIG
jgi:hypothetical protein